MDANVTPDQKYCKACNTNKPVGDFAFNTNGYRRVYCKPCTNTKGTLYKQERAKRDPQYAQKLNERVKKSQRKRRSSSNPEDIAGVILLDTRSSDKRANRTNDLDKPFVVGLISEPCSYCGEDKLRMTLDRIDNNLGHTKDNVVGACIRCNYARRSMPHVAWLCLVPGLTQAREQGLFGEWTGRCR